MATANGIILIVSMLVFYTAGILIYVRDKEKYSTLLLVIVVLSTFTGLSAIITDFH